MYIHTRMYKLNEYQLRFIFMVPYLIKAYVSN